MTRMPVSSPWAPAAGCSETAGKPPISPSCCCSVHISSSVPCARASGASGCSVGEAGQARRPLVDLGVVLHRARAQRVEAAVDRVVEVREAHEVVHHGGLVDLGQRRRRAARRCSAGMPSSASAGAWGTLNEERPGACSSDERRLQVRPHAPSDGRSRGTSMGRGRLVARCGSVMPSTSAQAGHQALDVLVGGQLGGAEQQRVGEVRVVGIPARQRQAGQDALRRAAGRGRPRRRARARRTR